MATKENSLNHPRMMYVASLSELFERFSFYIVEALLIVYLIDAKHLSQAYSYELLGTYISNTFILTVFGSFFGQHVLGFRNAVNFGAFLMSAGYCLLLNSDLSFLYYSLALISVGSAFFKPNMACFVGSLYEVKNCPRYSSAFNLYYAAIMLGVILSTSISGFVLNYLGWKANFLLASLGMILAFFIFLLGNKFYQDPEHGPKPLFATALPGWLLTIAASAALWFCVHAILKNNFLARLEIAFCGFLLLSYFIRTFYYVSKRQRQNLAACVVLLFFACMYWSLLFQLFFSLNVMMKTIVARELFHFDLPPSLFLGYESLVVIIASPLLGSLWIKAGKAGWGVDVFSKFTAAFMFCSLGLLTLCVSFYFSSSPHFFWVLGAYTCIGIGEAILAPTALAMIAQLTEEKQIGVMMAALYVFWGCGTKLAGIFAEWSVFPPELIRAEQIAPYFAKALTNYTQISFGMVLLCMIAGKAFQLKRTSSVRSMQQCPT